MLIKLPLNALSAINWHQIDARYPFHYGKMELLKHLKWNTQREQKSVFCSVMGAAPAALRAKHTQNSSRANRHWPGFQKVPKAWVNTGVPPVLSSVLPLSHCQQKWAWLFCIYFSASPAQQSSECPKNISCTHWQIVPLSEHGAIYFWRLLHWLLVWMLLLPCNSQELWFPWEWNDPWRKETREEALIHPKFRCAFLGWWMEVITNMTMSERFGDVIWWGGNQTYIHYEIHWLLMK